MKPIYFPASIADEMIRAILAGRKTVTRRVAKPQPKYDVGFDGEEYFVNVPKFLGPIRSRISQPYHPCDILYVQETWCKCPKIEDGSVLVGSMDYRYKADGVQLPDGWSWSSSSTCRREAARIFLRVASVTVERLQDITELQILEDEGLQVDFPQPKPSYCSLAYTETRLKPAVRDAFAKVWNSTVNPADRDRYGWEADPWVWVIAFERISKEEAMKNDSQN